MPGTNVPKDSHMPSAGDGDGTSPLMANESHTNTHKTVPGVETKSHRQSSTHEVPHHSNGTSTHSKELQTCQIGGVSGYREVSSSNSMSEPSALNFSIQSSGKVENGTGGKNRQVVNSRDVVIPTDQSLKKSLNGSALPSIQRQVSEPASVNHTHRESNSQSNISVDSEDSSVLSTNGSSHFSYDISDLDSAIGSAPDDSSNGPDSGACANPTVWIGDDQMLLLAGASASASEEDSNSGTSETKSFEGLLSPNGTSILWDENTDWILLFDNMIRYADRKPTRTTRSCGCKGHRTEDEPDSRFHTLSKAAAKRASSAPPVRRGVFGAAKSASTVSSTPKRKPSMKSTSNPSSSSAGAGGADEEMFMRSFEDVTNLVLYSVKDLESEMSKIKTALEPTNDWEKRVEAIKRLRSILIAGGSDYPEFFTHLRSLEHPFQSSVKDLRSQVVREACISIAYLSQQLGSRLDHFAESLLPCLINLIPNSAKIMSTAGIVATRFIIRYTHVSRLIPIITSLLTSKSKDIRKACFEFLDQLLITWPTHTLERHVNLLQDAIRKGISDADPEARAFSRKAFWSFADHFRDQADHLLNSLDNSKQRMLHDELTMSNSSSSSSLTQSSKPNRQPSYNHGSVENLSYNRTGTLGRRSGIPLPASGKAEPVSGIPKQFRSTSAIDLGAARRAKARSTYSTAANLIRGSGASLSRTGIRRVDSTVGSITSPERVMKTRNKGSQSQPNSRPDSPSSRLTYASYSPTDSTPGRVRRKSGIPTATSRETSPTRSAYASHERRLSGSRTRLMGAGEKYQPVTSSQPLMAERVLQQSREAEVAVAEALRTPARRRYNAFDDQSDESETSSVCSDRSFSSYGRGLEDIGEIIHNMSSVHWTDRKDGLQALQAFLRSSRMLSSIELKKITDIFTKIFMDPHTKVFTLFLDTLNELLLVHKQDLHGWLYVLLTRLFLKMGADILGSVLAKIQKTLELVKESFPCDHQFNAIMRFLNDQTQTPNNKVKIALLNYLSSLINEMDPSKFSSANVETRFGLMKIISWTATPKSSDLKKSGEDVLLALFNLNPPEYSNLLDQLPKTYKDNAFRLLHTRYPRSGSDSLPSAGTRTSPCAVKSHLQSPNSTWSRSHGSTPQNRSFEYDDTENLNPEELSNLIKKTLSEIEEYKPEYYEKEKIISQSPSRDSGISPNMAVDGRLDTLMDRLDLGSSTDSSPTKRSPTDYPATHFDMDVSLFDLPFVERSNSGDTSEVDNDIDDHKTLCSIIDELNQNSRDEKKCQALGRLMQLTREQSSVITNEDFRVILRVVIQTVEDPKVRIRSRALTALGELIKYKPENFQEYVELTLLKILEAHKDTNKYVPLFADECSAIAAKHLSLEPCVRTLIPLISTAEKPINEAAIKMLTKLVEHHPKTAVLQLLPEIMPAVIKSYDDPNSSIRKAAVFCMVAVHGVVGDAIQAHLASLNGSQLKLLHVYIRKSQAQNSCGSTPGSPGNTQTSTNSQ